MGVIIRDVEDLTRQIITVFKSKLNTEIELVNSEKASNDISSDDVAINTISSDAWYLSQVPKVWSFPTYVIWGLERHQLSSQQEDNAIRNIKYFFEVVAPDSGNIEGQHEFYNLLRYTRALEQVVVKNVDKIQRGMKFRVDSLIPAIAIIDGKKIRTAGISLETNISAF